MTKLVDIFETPFFAVVDKHFVNVAKGVRGGVLGGDTVFLQFTLGEGREEYPNGIIQNDPVNFSAYVAQIGENEYELEVKPSVGNLKPTEKYYAQSSIKIRTRKAKGDVDKLMKSLDKTIGKIADTVMEQYEAGNFLDLPFIPGSKTQQYWEEF